MLAAADLGACKSHVAEASRKHCPAAAALDAGVLLQLEAAAAAMHEEKRKGEAVLEAAEARFAAREALMKEEWDRCVCTSTRFALAPAPQSGRCQ